jgi:chemotaxis protein methyltransferase CheR
VTDTECVQLLQWCLPRLGLQWRGYRKVRRIVRRRIERRLAELDVPDATAYRRCLEANPNEWTVLERACRIPVSRFYRDRAVFECLERVVLPELAAAVVGKGETELRCWSAGCAAGEEPYTLAVLWRLRVAARFPGVRLRIVATDVEPEAIERAARACYPGHTLRDLPVDLAAAFGRSPEGLCLADQYRRDVELSVQDVRVTAPEGHFHLILCRYLVLTYFDEALQRQTLTRLVDTLEPDGVLVVGVTERMPEPLEGLVPWSARLRIYRAARRAARSSLGAPSVA